MGKENEDGVDTLVNTNDTNDKPTLTNDELADPRQIPRDGIQKKELYGYSVGHFANDLCASMWFIYLSYYLLYVVGLSENTSGLALLSG